MGEAPLDEYRVRHQDPQGRFDALYKIDHLTMQIGLQYGLDLVNMRRAPFGDARKIKLMDRVAQLGGEARVMRFLEWAMTQALEQADWLDQVGWNVADMYLMHCKGAVRLWLVEEREREQAAMTQGREVAPSAPLLPEQEKGRRAAAPRAPSPLPSTPTLATVEQYRGGPNVSIPVELLRLDDAEFIEFFRRPEFLRLPLDPHQGNMLFGWLIRPAKERDMSFIQWCYYMIDMRRRYAGMIAIDHAQSRATRCGCEACYYVRGHQREVDRLLGLPVEWRQRQAVSQSDLDEDLFTPEDYIRRGLDPETRHYTLEDRARMEEAARAWNERRAVLWQDARLNRPPC